MLEIPEVIGYGSLEVEPFESYLERWPEAFSEFPNCLIENWVYRHWQQFRDEWFPAGVLHWHYEKRCLWNTEVMEISHFPEKLAMLDAWGADLFTNRRRQSTWLATYMLQNGTTPAPILVFESDGATVHPNGFEGERMVAPWQLIEGHMRLAYLRGLIAKDHPALKLRHEVWFATENT